MSSLDLIEKRQSILNEAQQALSDKVHRFVENKDSPITRNEIAESVNTQLGYFVEEAISRGAVERACAAIEQCANIPGAMHDTISCIHRYRKMPESQTLLEQALTHGGDPDMGIVADQEKHSDREKGGLLRSIIREHNTAWITILARHGANLCAGQSTPGIKETAAHLIQQQGGPCVLAYHDGQLAYASQQSPSQKAYSDTGRRNYGCALAL